MSAYVPIEFSQGEDFAAQIVWTDTYDEPQMITAPARMDIKSRTGATVATLQADEDLPDGAIPSLGISEELGLIQLYLPKSQTAAIDPGEYVYDLFVSVDDGDAYAGNQVKRLMHGSVTINKRTTTL